MKILYLLRDKLEALPPSMSQIVTLCELGCQVKVVTGQASNYIRDFFATNNVEFLAAERKRTCKINVFNKVIDLLKFRTTVKKALKGNDYDLVWIGSADTAMYCRDMLEKCDPKVLNIYELYDKNPKVIRGIKSIAQSAKAVIVPEYNRAHILKVWLELKQTPTIIPNKPYFPQSEIKKETEEIAVRITGLQKKIVLYQGWIGKGRDVTKIAEALNTLEDKDDYALVLMGQATASDAISSIQEKFANTIHIPFLQPPQHLFVTETAYIGIATYGDSSLNNIFCAPNKIYEYAEKDVPILARDIPGLASTVGTFKAGVCVNMDDVDDIVKGIRELDSHHNAYVAALKAFREEYDINEILSRIIENCGVSNTGWEKK